MFTVALYNLKGGVGKTSAAVNLAYLASTEARPTLLFDMDPQGSASFFFRVRPSKSLKARSIVKGGNKLESAIRGSDYPYLDILPADITYRNLPKILREQKHPKRRLAKVFGEFQSDYEFLFVDCPPGISLEAENIFRAADLILMPLIPTTLSLETKETVFTFIRERGLTTRKIVPFFSMADRRKKLHREILSNAPESHPEILDVYIPVSSSIEKMGIERQPLCAISASDSGSKAYSEIWSRVKDFLWQ